MRRALDGGLGSDVTSSGGDPTNNVLLRRCQPLDASSHQSEAARGRVGPSAHRAMHTVLEPARRSTWPALVSAARDVEFADQRTDLCYQIWPQPYRLAVLEFHHVVAGGQAGPDIDHGGGNVR